jgi:hypothetical protein
MARMIAYTEIVFLLLIHALSGAVTTESINPSVEGADGFSWYDIRYLDVEGKGWTDTKSFYDRLPAKAEAVVRGPVWNLSHDSAGMCVRFVTDTNEIQVRWELRSKSLAMPHMPATGVSGLDLYVKDTDGKWQWLATGRPIEFPVNSVTIVKNIPVDTREYLLYLPLYNGVLSVEVGVPEGSVFRKAAPYPKNANPLFSTAHQSLRAAVPHALVWSTRPFWDDGYTILSLTLVSPETVAWNQKWLTFLPNLIRLFIFLTACRI